MAILVFVECSKGEIKKSAREAVSYAAETAKLTGEKDIVAVIFGECSNDSLSIPGQFGATNVLHFEDKRLNQEHAGAFSGLLSMVMKEQQASILIMTKSAFTDLVAGRVAGLSSASVVSGVVSLPELDGGFIVRKSIFTGKAFAKVAVEGDLKILVIRKNTIQLQEGQGTAEVVKRDVPADLVFEEKVTGADKTEGELLLDEAEIVVSGGRGMKGPENWGVIEDLARALGAATGCSKPVSDLGWRPHHEHVGQTGVKVSPNLYIAVGISGAIQHLAGVNSSRVLVAINKDPEAPFFKAADYGIIGDAFEILPRLTNRVKSL